MSAAVTVVRMRAFTKTALGVVPPTSLHAVCPSSRSPGMTRLTPFSTRGYPWISDSPANARSPWTSRAASVAASERRSPRKGSRSRFPTASEQMPLPSPPRSRPVACCLSPAACSRLTTLARGAHVGQDASWEWMGPGGSRGLQNRCVLPSEGWEGSTPSHSRQHPPNGPGMSSG